MGNRKPGRPPKHTGLATPASLKKVVANGSELQDLRASNGQPEEPVLQAVLEESAPQARTRGVFGAADPDDGGRRAEAQQRAVPNAPGRATQDGELRLANLFKSLLNEVCDPAFGREYGAGLTNAEVLARRILNDALSGDKAARELVIDRVEGKAVRGEKVQSSDTTVEDQVDEATVALLNGLSGSPDKGTDNGKS